MATLIRALRRAAEVLLLASALGIVTPSFSPACPVLSGCHLLADPPCAAEVNPYCLGCPSDLCAYNCNGYLYEIPGTHCCICT